VAVLWTSRRAYVFTRSGTSWSQQVELTLSPWSPTTCFGWSVALSGDTALVGADHGAVGAAYVFTRSAPAGRSRPS